MTAIKVNFYLGPFKDFKNQITQDLRGGGQGPIGRAIRQDWPQKYFEFLRRKFRENSAGGGEWPPLAESTLARESDVKKTRSERGQFKRKGILWKTGSIYNALTPGNKGNLIVPLSNGVRCGIGGAVQHPTSRKTLLDLVKIHDSGGGTVPRRQILYPPDEATIAAFQRSIKQGWAQLASKYPQR